MPSGRVLAGPLNLLFPVETSENSCTYERSDKPLVLPAKTTPNKRCARKAVLTVKTRIKQR